MTLQSEPKNYPRSHNSCLAHKYMKFRVFHIKFSVDIGCALCTQYFHKMCVHEQLYFSQNQKSLQLNDLNYV